MWYRNPKHLLVPVLLLAMVSAAITACIIPRPVMSAQIIYTRIRKPAPSQVKAVTLHKDDRIEL